MVIISNSPPSTDADDLFPARTAWSTLDGWQISTQDEVFYGTAAEVIAFCGMADGRMFHGHGGRVTSVAGHYQGRGTLMILRPVTS